MVVRQLNGLEIAWGKELSDALPRLDSLEKLLLERNKIGPPGAQALAHRLPRSNVRDGCIESSSFQRVLKVDS